MMIDTSKESFRKQFAHLSDETRTRFERRLKRKGIDSFSFSTDSDFVKILKEFFQMRKSRRS